MKSPLKKSRLLLILAGLFALTFSLTACEDPTGITGGDDDSDSDSAAGPGG